jgi:Ser/Thr protein kinase RdoA (MazF antagonist)
MDRNVKTRFNDELLGSILRRYTASPDGAKPLDGFESFIYEYSHAGKDYILRIGHSLRRDKPLVLAEVNWINHLADGGARVARAVQSLNDNLVETIDDGHGDDFIAASFVKARGTQLAGDAWTPELIEEYGRTLGKLHALSKNYSAPVGSVQRPAWNERIMCEIYCLESTQHAGLIEYHQEIMDQLEGLDKNPEVYGLIHQDAHAGNFLVDDTGKLTLFDFDDCTYSWFVNDLAIALFYRVFWEEDAGSVTDDFLRHLIAGYREETSIESSWVAEIPYFMKIRELDLFAAIHRSFDVDNIQDPFPKHFMKNRLQRIEAGVPTINFDFEKLAADL